MMIAHYCVYEFSVTRYISYLLYRCGKDLVECFCLKITFEKANNAYGILRLKEETLSTLWICH